MNQRKTRGLTGRVAETALILGAALVIGIVSMPAASAQTFPTRTVRIIAPFPPGGAVDLVSRLVAKQLEGRFGQPVVVENRPGATGQLGVDLVAKASPDGHTAVMAASGAVAINVHLTRLPYDPVKDLVAITRTVLTPSALAVPASLPVHTLKEFINYVKARPGKISYATSGIGSQLHLAGELLKQRTGIDMVAVPYRGTQPTTLAIVTGEVQAGISDLSTLVPQHAAGKVRILAVVDGRRSLSAPDIPTVAESGVPGFVASAWLGLFTTGGTPPDRVVRWNKEVVEILRAPDMLKTLLANGVEPVPDDSPEAAAATLRAEIDRWGSAIKAANIKLDQSAK
jgi:tripartite-type tricarboxylate transporter receptor subunit TctC